MQLSGLFIQQMWSGYHLKTQTIYFILGTRVINLKNYHGVTYEGHNIYSYQGSN